MAAEPVADFLDVLEAYDLPVRRIGQSLWMAQCPAHDDRTPSLQVGVGHDGHALVHCFAGCPTEDVVSAVGWTLSDLFVTSPDNGTPGLRKRKETMTQPTTTGPPVALPDEHQLDLWHRRLAEDQLLMGRLFQRKRWTPLTISACQLGWDGERITIPVRNALGALLTVQRYLPGGDPKMLGLHGRGRFPFPAPETVVGHAVWVVEGEPDAISMAEMGLPAVGVPGAAWARTHAEDFAARFASRGRVIVVADADDEGRQAARALYEALRYRVPRVDGIVPPAAVDVGDLLVTLGPAVARATLVNMVTAVTR